MSSFFRISLACAIELENTVVVTGGWGFRYTYSRVQVYSTEGPLHQLPNLLTSRVSHGCGYYVDSRNRVVSIVQYILHLYL